MDNLEEQKRLSKLNLRKLLNSEEVISSELANLKRHADKFKEFDSGENIEIRTWEESIDKIRLITLNIPEHILFKMISESIQYKESKLSEVQEAINTEASHLAKGDKQ